MNTIYKFIALSLLFVNTLSAMAAGEEKIVKVYRTNANTESMKIDVDNFSLTKRGDSVYVAFSFIAKTPLGLNSAVSMLPALQGSEGQTKYFREILLTKRISHVQMLRDGRTNRRKGVGLTEAQRKGYLDNDTILEVYHQNRRPQSHQYTGRVKYESWMDYSKFTILESNCHCSLFDDDGGLRGLYDVTMLNKEPDYFVYYEIPQIEAVKSRSLDGYANITYKLNKWDILPDYRGNRKELDNIIATVNKIRNAPDLKMEYFHLHGTASPEGPYDNNVKLARNRTQALYDYIRAFLNYDSKQITQDYTPENWEGLADSIRNHPVYKYNSELLNVVTSTVMTPDQKKKTLQTNFAKEYQDLYATVYPTLRRAYYRVAYSVKEYATLPEIREQYIKAPYNLSQAEMYTLARDYDTGSDEYRDVLLTAAKYFPKDDTANLNAATVEILRENLGSAENYIRRASECPRKWLTLAALYYKMGNKTEAEEWLHKAMNANVKKDANSIMINNK